MTHHGHLTNWALLIFTLGGYALCWLRRDWRITRLAKRCTWLEGKWRKAARERDAAQIAEMAFRVENEHLTDDLATAVHEEQVVREQLGYVSEQLDQRINHPSQRRDAELFERLEKDFS
jgi:hypothetical protein